MKKKILALVLSFTMLFGMSMTALADDDVAPAATATVQEHSFVAYQIFTGTYDDASKTLTNIQWGSGVSEEFKTAKGKAKDYAETITNDNAYAVAKEIAAAVTGDGIALTKTDAGYSVGNAAGYYLVVDVTASLTDGDSYNLSQLQVANASGIISVVEKKGTVTSEKKVDDKNDSTGAEDVVVWEDSADYDIGDDIPFSLYGTLPSDYDKYTTYYYEFEDEDEAGLALNEKSIKVYAVKGDNKTEITSDYAVTTGDNSFKVTFADLKLVTAVDKDTTIVVEYTAKLTEDAIIGAAGNPNKMRLKYSNNPNKEGYGYTPWDKVIVFTYKTVINKVDGELKALAGATFKLEKYVGTDENGAEKWVEKSLVVTAAADGTEGAVFTATGLDDGIYKITETDAPAGYNKLEPIYFEVKADHDKEAAEPQLKALTVNDTDVEKITGVLKTVVDANSGNLGTFTVLADKSGVETQIINQKGALLPSTGGVGTTIFYVIGGILVVGAAIVLIVRKRMSSEEE